MNAPSRFVRRVSRRDAVAGFTMVEAVIAVAIISISLGAMMTLNGQQLRLVKVTKDVNAASLYQQERVEQLRQLRWPDLTTASFIANTYMQNRPRSHSALEQVNESIRIAAYPKASQGSRALIVSQAGSGVTTIDSVEDGFALTNERLVQIDMTLRWKGADGRAQKRSTTTLISNSGITRSNLPAMGPVSGGPYEPFTTPPPATPAPTDPIATPAPATPAPATPAPGNGSGNNGNGNGNNGNENGNNGNGNGRGNTGGGNGSG